MPGRGSSPRSFAMRRTQECWNRLTKRTDQRVAEGGYQDLREALKDQGGEPILGVRKTLISVVVGSVANVRRFINANRIGLSRPAEPIAQPVVDPALQPVVTPSYVVGKSPANVDDYQAFLQHAIESKQGLFQFLPRRLPWQVQAGLEGSVAPHGKPSVLGRLLHDVALHAQANQPLCIDKYTVTNVRPIDTDLTLAPAQAAEKNPNFCHQYQVDVQWTAEDGQACQASVPITQVGLRFTGNVLQEAELEMAQAVFTRHLANIKDTVEPGICSPSGMGRSGTLMVHHEISQRIQAGLILDAPALDQQIEEVINKGREERGPYFVHSAAQLDVLRTALHKLFKSTQAQRADAKTSTYVQASPESIEVIHAPAASAPITIPSPVVQTLKDRINVVRDATNVLGEALIEMIKEFKNLDPNSDDYISKSEPISLRAVKLLRLQDKLLNWEIPHPPLAKDMPGRFQTTEKILRKLIDYQAKLDRNPNLSTSSSGGNDTSEKDLIIKANLKASNQIFKLEPLKDQFTPVVNGGADIAATLGADEGNNCLLVSILQHATGKYEDREHQEMVKVLRELLVRTSKNEKGDAIIEHGQALFDDPAVLQRIVNTVNALYGRDLQLHIMNPGFADTGQTKITPRIMSCTESRGTEPVLILKKHRHFEAVAPIAAIAVQTTEHDTQSAAKNATNQLQKEIYNKQRNNQKIENSELEKLNECLNEERNEAINKIKAIQIEEPESQEISGENKAYELLDTNQRDAMIELAAGYPLALLTEKIKIVSNEFNERLNAYFLQYNINASDTIKVDPIHPSLYPIASSDMGHIQKLIR